ncbi:MAG: lipoate--protein ligase family protein [Gemmatimonadota bacterium]
MSSARPWRLLLGTGDAGTGAALEARGARNMGLDDALLESAANGAPPTLRFYRWTPSCLSVGRNQPLRGRVDAATIAGFGWDIVRRPTGGLAVLHADEITYSVAAPVSALGRPRAAYAAINRALAAGLRALGLEARVTPPSATGANRVGAATGQVYLNGPEARCFLTAAPGEVTVSGRKIMGSAQRRRGRALLQHGSLLLSGSQAGVGKALSGAPAGTTPARAGTSLAAELGRAPADADILEALGAAFGELLAVGLERAGITAEEGALAERRAETYSSEAWTWRR